MAQQLVQNGQAFNVLNQYSLNELLNLDPDMAYNALQVMEGSADKGNAIEALEQFSQAQLWQAMLDCMSDVLIQIFSNYPDITNNILVQLCVINRTSMNEIANDMGYNNYYLLTNEQLVELLLSEGRYDELNSLIKTYFSNEQIVLVTGSSSFTLKDFLLNTYGYSGFLEALKCYDNEQLKQFLTTGTLSQSLVKTYLIASVYQQFLLEKLNEQNFVLYLQYVLQHNNINSINYAITNMQTQPVYNYLTWVKQSFGNSAYNSLASNLEFTRTLKLNDWQLYGSSRLGVYNADTTLTNITFTINGIDSNGNFEVNQVISQTSVSVDHYNMQHYLAYKQYELTNHLGNVLATVLDRKTNNTADVVTAQHYYPFGSVMSSYKAEEFGYRFGFNGQEKDDEISKLDGGHVVFEYRIHDSRLGRFLSVDPLEKEYPWNSPYAFAENRVIDGIDLEGCEWERVTDKDGNITGANWVGYNEDGTPKAGSFPAVAWTVEGESSTTLNYTSIVKGADGKMTGNINTVEANDFGMVSMPESGPGFARYSTPVNNEKYKVNDKQFKTDNWAAPQAAAAFINLCAEFFRNTGYTAHYGDISAYDPRINIGHSTHYLGMSFDVHYFGKDGKEVYSYLNADKAIMTSFLTLAKAYNFINNYSYGIVGLPNILNPWQDKHMDHFHLGWKNSQLFSKRGVPLGSRPDGLTIEKLREIIKSK